MRSCRSGRAGENPEEGGRRGADHLALNESERVGPERREEVQSGGAEGDGVGGEGLAQGGVWDDARPDPPTAQRSSAQGPRGPTRHFALPGGDPFDLLSFVAREGTSDLLERGPRWPS